MLMYNNRQHNQEELSQTFNLVNNFNFADFGLSLFPAFPLELKSSIKGDDQNRETVSMRVLSIDLLLYYSGKNEKIITKVDDPERTYYRERDKFESTLLKEARALLDKNTLPENSSFRDSFTFQILNALDGMIFSSETDLAQNNLAYIDGFKLLSPQAAGIECLESLVLFYKAYINAVSDRKKKDVFKCLNEIARKRLNNLQINHYAITLLPDYFNSLQRFELILRAREEMSSLSGYAMERFTETLKELAQGSHLELLLNDRDENNLAQMQLRSFVFGHLPLSFEGIQANHSLDEEAIDKVRMSTLIDSKRIIELFGVPEKDEKKKALQSVLFFAILANYFALDSHRSENPSEEAIKTLVELISEYYIPSAPDFRFLKYFQDFLSDSDNEECDNLRKSLLKSSFVNKTLRYEIWFNDKVLSWETIAGYSDRLVSYFPSTLIETLKEMDQLSEELDTKEGNEKLIKAKSQKTKEALFELIKRLKILISKSQEMAYEISQGKIDSLNLVFHKELISDHVTTLQDYIKEVHTYLKSEDEKEIILEIQDIFNIDWGLQNVPEVVDLIKIFSCKVDTENRLSTDIRTISYYISALEILNQMNAAAFDLFGSQESARNLSRSEIELFGRISYLYRSWECNSPQIFTDLDLDHLRESEKKISSTVMQSLYNIVYGIVSKNDLLDAETTQVPDMNLFGKNLIVGIQQSPIHLLFSGVVSTAGTFHSNAVNLLIESLVKLLEKETQTLKGLKEEQLESKNLLQIYNQIDSLLRVILLTAENLDESPSVRMKNQSLTGYIKIAFHKGLLERFLEYVGVAEEYDNLITLKIEPGALKTLQRQRTHIKSSIVTLTERISRKLLTESPQDSFKKFDAEGYSEEEQLEMVYRVSQLNYRVFGLISIFSFTIFAREGQLPADNTHIISLLSNQMIQEPHSKVEGSYTLIIPPTHEVAEEGEFSATGTIQTFPSHGESSSKAVVDGSNKIVPSVKDKDLEIFESKREEALNHAVIQSYPRIFQQIILLQGVSNLPQSDLIDTQTKQLVEKLNSNQEFNKFMKGIQQEAQLILQEFVNEPPEKLSDLTVRYLPVVPTQKNAGVNAFLSTLLFIRFYEKILSELPQEKRTFLEEQKFDFGPSSQEIYEKLLLLAPNIIEDLLKYNLFLELIEPFRLKSSEYRAREHSKLYEIPYSEFKEHEKATLEATYKGALVTLTKPQYYPERAVSLDCLNLLAVTIWDSSYLERIRKENIIDLLFKLEGKPKTSIIPFILDNLIESGIPIHDRIEIALKGIFLKPIKITILGEKNSLYYLQILNQSDPKSFTRLFKELLSVVEDAPDTKPKEKENKNKQAKVTWKYSIKLKNETDPLRLSQSKEEISTYLQHSVSITAIEIINKLLGSIVSDNEKALEKRSESENYHEVAARIDQNLYLLSALLSKYPELRIYTAETKVYTKVYDKKTLHFTELSDPQEMTFFDYLMHVISPTSYPQTAGAIRSFYEDFTPAFTLRSEGEVITSHEYFRNLVIKKSIAALSILSENNRVPHYHSLLYVYCKLIRDALDSEFPENAGNTFFCKLLGDLEKVICKFASRGKSLKDMRDLYRLFENILWLQMGTAFCKIEPRLSTKSLEVEEDDKLHIYARALLYLDRDYTKLESYTPSKNNVTDKDFQKIEGEEEKIDKKQELMTNDKLSNSKPRKLEDNFKALIVRALLEGKELSSDFVINFGRDYYSITKNSENDRIKDPKKSSKSRFALLQNVFLQNKKLSDGYQDDQSAVLSKIRSFQIFANPAQPVFNRDIEVVEWAPKEWLEMLIKSHDLEDEGDFFGTYKPNKIQKKDMKQLLTSLKEKKSKKQRKLAKAEFMNEDSGNSSSSGSGSDDERKDDDSFEIIPKDKHDDKINLFKGLERPKFKKTLSKIQQKLSQIIEKKLLSGFIEKLSEFGKVQGPSLTRPDPELNSFVNSLKNTEKRIALLALGEDYVGMLSRTFQNVRKRCQNLLSFKKNKNLWEGNSSGSGSDSGDDSKPEVRSSKSGSSFSAEEDVSGSEQGSKKSRSRRSSMKHDSEGDHEKETKSENEYNKEKSVADNEEEEEAITTSTVQATSQFFEGFRQNSKFPGHHYVNIEDILFKCTDVDMGYKVEGLADDFNDTLLKMYICNKKNNEAIRKALFVSSADFIDHFLANIIANSDYISPKQVFRQARSDDGEEDLSQSKFPILKILEIFMVLCCNPLNEIRLLDSILTLLSFDCENESALATFNDYFAVKLTSVQLQHNRSKFVETILFIFTRYYAAVPKQSNVFESNSFDRLVVEVEVLADTSSLKKQLLPHCPLLETPPKNFLMEFAVIVAKSGVTTRVATTAVKFVLSIKNIRTSLSTQIEPQAIAQKIADLIKILVVLDPEQPENLGAVAALSNFLESEDVFFDFLELAYKSTASMFRLIELRLQKTVSALKALTQEAVSAWSQVENQIERLSQDQSFKSLRLTLRLIANQSQNFLDDLSQIKGRLKKSDYNLVLRLKETLSKFHIRQKFGSAYLLLVQTFELLEAIKKPNPHIQNDLKPFKAPLDIALDTYRIFKIQGKMAEKFEEQQYFIKNTSNTETNPPIKPNFTRVATKAEEEYDGDDLAGDLVIPGFERSFSQIKQSGAIKIDELFVRLSHKAKDIIQSIVLEGLIRRNPEKDYDHSSSEEERPTAKFDVSKIKDMILLNKFPWLLKFEAKREYIYSKLREDKKEHDSDSDRSDVSIDIKIRREYIVKDTLDYFQKILLVKHNLRFPSVKFKVRFLKEEGIDQGGLENEWLNLVVKDLFDPAHGLFKVAENGVTIQPSPQSHVLSNYLAYFKLAGYITGYVIKHTPTKIPDKLSYCASLYHERNKEISIADLADVDEKLFNSLNWILNNNLEEGILDQDFTYELESFGRRLKVSLLEPGEKFGLVNEENKKLYVKRLIYWKLVKEIESQLNAFKEGFYKFVKLEHLSFFSSSELDRLIAGSPTINFEELQQTTKYSGYSNTSDIIKWFWQIVAGFDQEGLSALLFFAAGMNRVGAGGFKDKPLTVARDSTSPENLPTAHTCSVQIDLPQYPTKEVLAEKLLLAIFEGREGFGFS